MPFSILLFSLVKDKMCSSANIHTHPMEGHSRQTGTFPRGVGAVAQIKNFQEEGIGATQSIPFLQIRAKRN